MKKKIVVVLLAIMTCATLMLAAATAETTAATSTATAIDWGALLTQVVIWVLCGVLTALGAVATWAAKTYIIPWLKDVAIPWLNQHKLLNAAKVAVEYAEAMLGRYTGDEKWEMALGLLKKLGFDIDSDEVIAALKAKWLELNLAQVAAGVKETVVSTATEGI